MIFYIAIMMNIPKKFWGKVD